MSNEKTAEQLAQMNAHGVLPDKISGSGSNHSRTEIAGALHGITDLPLHLIWSEFIDATCVQGRLWYHAEMHVIDLAVEREWFLPRHDPQRGKETLRRMARLAILELTTPLRCQSCGGTRVNRLARACGKCRGTGNLVIRKGERARLLDIPYTSWRRQWRSRYHAILAHFKAQSEGALETIRDNMRHN